MDLDRFDSAILSALQQDGRISNRDLADKVALSPAPCWRRVRRLEEEGYIEKYVALANPKKVGLPLTAFAEVSLDNHHPETIDHFDQVVRESEAILECHSVTGQADYLIKVVAKDIEAYEQFLSHVLLQIPNVREVNTLFSLRQRKHTLELPLGNV